MTIIIEIDKQWTVGIDWFKYVKGIRFGFVAIHTVNSSLDVLTESYGNWLDCCEGYDKLRKNVIALRQENKQWETNYNNLSAEFEEVSAIAQAQAKEIERLNRIIRGFPPKNGGK